LKCDNLFLEGKRLDIFRGVDDSFETSYFNLRLRSYMKTWSVLKSILLAATSSFLLMGCVTHERVVYTEGPPPPVYVETASPAPAPGYVWVGGSWIWRGQWVWAPGRWNYPPRAHAVWVSSRYQHYHGHYVYVRGYWR